jgi:hypothetical protein
MRGLREFSHEIEIEQQKSHESLIEIDRYPKHRRVNGGAIQVCRVEPGQVVFESTGGDGQFAFGMSPPV